MDTNGTTQTAEVITCLQCGEYIDPDDVVEFYFAPGATYCFDCGRSISRGVV